ncbi:MAG: glycosyltransferase family 4 protein [bacterium]|nr:glycosyltransferase family 4 protein [bacterium]
MIVAVDAANLLHDGRGMGRYVREVLRRLRTQVEIRLVTEQRDTESRRGYAHALGYYEAPLVSAGSTGADVLWYPWNLTQFRPRKPYAVTIYDVAPFHFPHASPWVRWREQRRLRRAATHARAVIAISEFARGEIVERLGADASRVSLAPPGAAAATFTPGAPERLPEYLVEHPYLLYVGAVEARKNVATLLAAQDRIYRETGIPLVCAGGSVPERDGVISMGYVDEALLVSLYRGATALAIPSLYEGFGLPALEAMACGTPVVAARRAALPEVCGGAALYVDDPGEIPAWSEALRRISADGALAADLRQRGPARAAAFTWERTAEATLQALRAVAAG